MTYVNIIGGGQLEADAAAHWDQLEEAYKERWGEYLGVNSALRTYAQQEYLYNGWIQRLPGFFLAAKPGHSLHEKGLSVDVAAPANVDGSAQHEWLEANAGKFGFKWTGKNFWPREDWHFDYIGAGAEGTPAISEAVRQRQEYLNATFNAGLVVDGLEGPKTKAAVAAYQKVLGFTGADVDGIWGAKTQAAHQKYYDDHHRPAPKPQPAPKTGNPFGIVDVRGLQKIARLYGYKGPIDNIWGDGSAAGFAEFLRRNWGYRGNDEFGPVMAAAVARWLRKRWGYIGNDVFGPVMRISLNKANSANFTQLK